MFPCHLIVEEQLEEILTELFVVLKKEPRSKMLVSFSSDISDGEGKLKAEIMLFPPWT